MNPSLLFDLQKYHHRAWKMWLDFKDHFIRDQIERSIEQGKEEGYFRPQVNKIAGHHAPGDNTKWLLTLTLFPKRMYSLSMYRLKFSTIISTAFTEKAKAL